MTFICLRFPSESDRPNKISYRWMGRRKRHLERMERCKRRPFLCKSLCLAKKIVAEPTSELPIEKRVGYVFRRYNKSRMQSCAMQIDHTNLDDDLIWTLLVI